MPDCASLDQKRNRRLRPSEVDVAQRLQDRFPELGDKLAGVVEFLQVRHRRFPHDAAGGDLEAETGVNKRNLREVSVNSSPNSI